ncbi:MAG TPA: NmrA family NAD(P)-binding protein [Planktothrix sp.]|jgi:uncharacterized protein YbjT (DUF2867 family)
MDSNKRILVMGVTGQLGKLVVDRLKGSNIRVTTRRKDDVAKLKSECGDAVYMDLDDPTTFDAALKGVDSLFMLTGYTVAMLVQSKALVDAAQRVGVKHIVHLGVFTPDPHCYDAHFAWHQMIEVYIKHSGIKYTFLHPNCFMQNFTGFYGMIKNGNVCFYANDKRVGWIALEDVAEAASKILSEGAPHYGKDYWFSTELANPHDIAKIFSEVTGAHFGADARSPEQFLPDISAGADPKTLDPYFLGVADGCKQMVDGRMDYICTVRDDMQTLFGKKGITLAEWAALHKEELLKLAKQPIDV